MKIGRLGRWIAPLLGVTLVGVSTVSCSATSEKNSTPFVGTAAEAVLGPTTWDSSCFAADIPELQRAFTRGMVGVNSPAFAACVETSFTTYNDGGLPGLNMGPYLPCAVDPKPVTSGFILASVRSPNPTSIACDYGAIGTSNGGGAGIGGVDFGNSSNAESITLGGALTYLTGVSGPCSLNPSAPNCAPGTSYATVAGVIFHEFMHQHGFDHVSNNWFAFTEQSSQGKLCGIPYSAQPTYGSSVPYIVEQCLFAVLAQSDAKCPTMYTDCGEGLSLVDSLYSATPSCSCVQALQRSSVGSPRISAISQSSVSDYFALDEARAIIHNRWKASSNAFLGWESLGGTFISAPVGVAGAHGSGTVDVFGQGTNGSYYHKYFNGTVWSPSWEALPGTYIERPAVVSWGTNRLDVFGRGTDRAYYHLAWTPSGWPMSPEGVGGTFNGPPSVAAEGPGLLRLLGRGTDNHYYHKSYNGTAYSPSGVSTWGTVGPGTFVTDPVIAKKPGVIGIDIFGQGTDMKYYHQAETNQPLELLGPAAYMGPPAAQWQSSTRLDVVGQGIDSFYYHQQQSSLVWSALEGTGMSGYGGATLIVPSTGDVNVIVEGTDHHPYFKDLRTTTWSAVIAIPGSATID